MRQILQIFLGTGIFQVGPEKLLALVPFEERQMVGIPSGEHRKSDGKLPFIVVFPMKNGDFP